jgi:signal transduction histidine kinase
MQNVDFLMIAAVTLLVTQSALLLLRTRSCARRVEPLIFAAFLSAVAMWLVTPSHAWFRDSILVFLLWAGRAFLLAAGERRKLGLWSSLSSGFLLALLLAWLLGHRGSVPYAAFRALGLALLSGCALRELSGYSARSRLALTTLLFCCIWLAAGTGNLAAAILGSPLQTPRSLPALLVAVCTGLLIFHEGYPLMAGWGGSLVGLGARDRLTHEVLARLQEKEDALARQNRLIASGLLAVGAAHEFKNMLAHVKTTAEFGLSQRDPGRKDESFRLLLRHAEAGRGATIGLLESISRHGAGKPQIIDAARDLPGFLRMVRAAFRGDGIVIEAELAEGVRFLCRRDEVEQVLLNLVRNAAEVYREGPADGEQRISVTARRQDEMAVLEVKDRAGGVRADAEDALFTPSRSARSTGLGLSLSRSLAVQNQGSLEYEPVAGGSIFRLVFPLFEEEPPAAS